MGTALSQKWLFILRCVFSEVRGRSVVRRRHVGLEMSHAVWAAVGLLGNLEINAAGIIFDSTLGKPSVCTKNKTKNKRKPVVEAQRLDALSGHHSVYWNCLQTMGQLCVLRRFS